MRKLFDLQKEKETLSKRLAQEEENLHTNLKRRLKDLQQEKVDTENMLE
jgi:predicted nuclease with TOPRIM domain